jgi:nucleotide-binding universal stress UspA family protein
MEIKSIQLAADSDPSYPARLAFTLDLADILAATVTVVHAMSSTAGKVAVGRAASPVYLEALRESAEERAEALRVETMRIAEEKGHAPRWISDTRDVRDIVAQEALLSDLTVVGRGRETTLEDWVRDHLVDYLSKTVATPILYVPPVVPEHVVMGSVLIAWDASHPAMRAVRGGLPFLRRAREVHVIASGKPRDPEIGAAEALRDYLHRHGIDAVAHGNETDEKDAARAIHAMADSLGANWMIMGANSKPKLQALLFGSMTRALMKDTKIPLLMSA